MKCQNGCQQCNQGSTLERNLSINLLNIGDFVSPEGKYVTSKGCCFPMGTGFIVKRLNTKSVTLIPVEAVTGIYTKKDAIRINRRTIEYFYRSLKEVEPLFARDNTRNPFKED